MLAHELGLPTGATGLAATLVSGHTMPLWPGLVRSAAGSRLFVQMLGIGFDAHVVHHGLAPGEAGAFGRGAYVLQTLRELPRYRFPPIRLLHRRRGRHRRQRHRRQGHPLWRSRTCSPRTRHPGAPGFSVVLFEHAGIASALLAGAALPLNLLGRVPGLTHRRASEVQLLDENARPAQADGDPAGNTPLRVTDAPHPIAVQVGRARRVARQAAA